MEDFLSYKDYPEGSSGKRMYDRNKLPLSEYISKYYGDHSLDRWHRFYTKFITPIIHGNRMEYESYLYQMKPPFSVDFNRFDEFVAATESDMFCDKELYFFMAFLYSIMFFKRIPDFEDWINTKQTIFMGHSLKEMITYDNGINFVKSELREISILNHG